MAKLSIRIIKSSSQANCIVLDDGLTHLFLDFGASLNVINRYLEKHNVSMNKIAGCLLTHYHKDHIIGIGTRVSKDLNIYSSTETFEHLNNIIHGNNKNFIEHHINIKIKNKKWINVGDSNWQFKWFTTIHNAVGAIGFLVRNRKTKILYFTDSEFFHNKLFKNNHIYIVECNYGTDFIDNKNKISKHLKNKINHMNLEDVENFYNKYVRSKAKLFLFSHLSQESCDNQLLKIVINELLLKNRKIEIYYLEPNLTSKQKFSI